MHGFNRLTEDDGVSNLNFRAIKEHLAKDAPVVIGMMVGGTFMQGMMGKRFGIQHRKITARWVLVVMLCVWLGMMTG